MSKASVTAGAVGLGLLVLRLGVGSIMFAHGLQKLGMFGGHDLNATVGWIQQTFGVPIWLAYLAVAAEVLGGLGLIVGFLGRIAAFAIACNMAVAIFGLLWTKGFWSAGGGFEFELALGVAALSLMLTGMGPISIDALIARKMDKTIGSK